MVRPENVALFQKMLAENPDLREKVRAVLATASHVAEAYQKLPPEIELELWKAADEATCE
jgi:hypothetical protein